MQSQYSWSGELRIVLVAFFVGFAGLLVLAVNQLRPPESAATPGVSQVSDPMSSRSTASVEPEPQHADVNQDDGSDADVSAPIRLQPPVAEQVEQLNSKNNDNLVIEPVGANLYRASMVGVHQAVPVATLNDDGSVSIAEY